MTDETSWPLRMIHATTIAKIKNAVSKSCLGWGHGLCFVLLTLLENTYLIMPLFGHKSSVFLT